MKPPFFLKSLIGSGMFSQDGRLLVLNFGNHLHIFDVATGKDLFQIPHEHDRLVAVAISPDKRMLLTSAIPFEEGFMVPTDQDVSLWEITTRQLRKKIIIRGGAAGPVAFSAD